MARIARRSGCPVPARRGRPFANPRGPALWCGYRCVRICIPWQLRCFSGQVRNLHAHHPSLFEPRMAGHPPLLTVPFRRQSSRTCEKRSLRYFHPYFAGMASNSSAVQRAWVVLNGRPDGFDLCGCDHRPFVAPLLAHVAQCRRQFLIAVSSPERRHRGVEFHGTAGRLHLDRPAQPVQDNPPNPVRPLRQHPVQPASGGNLPSCPRPLA